MQVIINITTTGSAGSASGTTTSGRIRGWLYAINVDYHASAPATTDITITEANSIGRTLYSKANSVTDVTVYPYIQATDTTGTALSGVYQPIYIDWSGVTVALAQCDALTNAVVVTLVLADTPR